MNIEGKTGHVDGLAGSGQNIITYQIRPPSPTATYWFTVIMQDKMHLLS